MQNVNCGWLPDEADTMPETRWGVWRIGLFAVLGVLFGEWLFFVWFTGGDILVQTIQGRWPSSIPQPWFEAFVSRPFLISVPHWPWMFQVGLLVTAIAWLVVGRSIRRRWSALVLGGALGAAYRISGYQRFPWSSRPEQFYLLVVFIGGGVAGALLATISADRGPTSDVKLPQHTWPVWRIGLCAVLGVTVGEWSLYTAVNGGHLAMPWLRASLPTDLGRSWFVTYVSQPFRVALSELQTILPAGAMVIAAAWLRVGRMIEGRRAALLMGMVIGASYRVSFIGRQPVGPYEMYFFTAFVGGGSVGALVATVARSGWPSHQAPQRP
jgi:hypothetical protein